MSFLKPRKVLPQPYPKDSRANSARLRLSGPCNTQDHRRDGASCCRQPVRGGEVNTTVQVTRHLPISCSAQDSSHSFGRLGGGQGAVLHFEPGSLSLLP